jgi:hypothetical protein
MQNTLSLISPIHYAERLAVEEIRRELDIAAEIFVVQNRAIHYGDIMENKTGEASKTMLLAWLDDCVRKGVTSRDGIITLYKAANPDHFENGKWRAQYLPLFIDFALRRLTDSGYVKDKKRTKLFTDSLMSEEWFWQAVSVMSVRLFEDLYAQNGLQSMSAKFAIGEMMRYREMFDKFGRLVGRVGKTGELDEWTRSEMKQTLQGGLKEAMKQHTQMLAQTKEYVFFEKHVPAIKGMLNMALRDGAKQICTRSG